MTDITDIKRALARSALSVAQHLLPGGRKEGQEWRVGSVDGEKGRSLGVHLAGDKAGVWADFNTGEGGDLLDLWCQVRRADISQALAEARDWLGMPRPTPYREPAKTFVRPPKPACRTPEATVLDYLREDRNLPAEVIAAYRVGEAGDNIVFPFLLPDGELAMAKTRKAFDGARPMPTAANCEPILFGWQAIPANAREVVITEGEIDALSWAAYGMPALSVPYGGGKGAKQNWIESEFDRLERFERIYISTDMDAVGDEAAEEIASRLGRHRCLRVHLPAKDANECLMAGVSREAMQEAIRMARGLDPSGLKQPSDFAEDVIALLWPQEGERVGYTLPYAKIGDKLQFRPAELTIWTGSTGAGKTQILSDAITHWVHEGGRTCLVSFEMKPAQTLRRMVKQVTGLDRPTQEYVVKALRWLDHGLLIFDHVGKRSLDAILEVFDYARAKYGCDQFVLDSLIRIGVEGDDYNGQEKAIYAMVEWAIAKSVHFHLVAHSRKGERDRGPPETDDIKGAMEVGANAFNVIAVWRNRKHEADLAAAQTDEERHVLDEKPGVILSVTKQRNGDFEGKVGLWFDQRTYRYHSSHDRGLWSNRVYDIDGRQISAA